MLQGKEMSAGFHSRNLILGIECFRLIMLNVCQWYEGFLYRGDGAMGGESHLPAKNVLIPPS